MGVNTDDSDRIIAEDRNGYFIPRTRAAAVTYVDELKLEAEVRNQATTQEVAATVAKIQRVWPASADSNAATANSISVERNDQIGDGNWDRFFPYYRFLEFGESLRQGDEFSPDAEQTWRGTHFSGEIVKFLLVGKYRRKIDLGDGYRALKPGETIQPEDSFLDEDVWVPAGPSGIHDRVPDHCPTLYRRLRTHNDRCRKHKGVQ